jgi:hypothetical protein
MWGTLKASLKRYWRKWRQVPLHERLNVSVATTSLLVSVLAIALTVIALQMTREQGEIARRQAAIAERQFQILNEQLGREAAIEVDLETWSFMPMVLLIRNKGLAPKRVGPVSIYFPLSTELDYSIECKDPTTGQRVPPTFMSETARRQGVLQDFMFFRSYTIAAGETLPILTCNVALPSSINAGTEIEGSEFFKNTFRIEWLIGNPDGDDFGDASNDAIELPLGCFSTRCVAPKSSTGR